MDFSYLRNIMKYAVSAVLSLIIIAYIVYHLTGGFSPEIETSTALLTTGEQTMTANAIIMRNEQIVYSTVEGHLNYVKNDGTRVAMGTKVAEVFDLSEPNELCERIISLNKRIQLLEDSNMSDSERMTDTASTDKKIWNGFYSLLNYSAGGSMSAADVAKDSLLINLNKRRIITKSVSNYSELITELKEERTKLYAKLTTSITSVNTNNSGYFYSFVDGYENVYSSANIPVLGYQSVKDLALKEPEDYLDTGYGYPIGKLVSDYQWYIICEIDYANIHNYESSKDYDIRFPQNNDTTVSMTLYRILTGVDADTAILVFRASSLPNNFSYSRNQTVQIVCKSYNGYRIPSASVHIVNGQTGVYVLKGTEVSFRKVSLLFEYDGYFIVGERDENARDKNSWLNKNDLVITKGKDLYDGKIVG